jgi:hypothetical protein
MEMEFHFAINHAADSFDQAAWFVIGFALPFDLFQRSSREYRERALVDDLISRVEFRHDEMHCRTVSQHAVLIGVFVGTESRKRGEQSMMQVDDSAGKTPTGAGWEDSHVAGQQDVVDLVAVEDLDHLVIVRFPLRITDGVPGNVKLFGHTSTGVAVA